MIIYKDSYKNNFIQSWSYKSWKNKNIIKI